MDKFEKIKNTYRQHPDICNALIVVLLVLIGAILFKGHYNNLLTDFGREMLFPAAILDGKVNIKQETEQIRFYVT